MGDIEAQDRISDRLRVSLMSHGIKGAIERDIYEAFFSLKEEVAVRIISDFDRAMRTNRELIRHPISYLVNMARVSSNVEEKQLDVLLPAG